jgi:hypothetical protein
MKMKRRLHALITSEDVSKNSERRYALAARKITRLKPAFIASVSVCCEKSLKAPLVA